MIFDLIKKSAEINKDRPAFVIRRRIRKERITYGELPGLLEKTAVLFESRKIKVADKILFWGTNCPEYSILLLSCFSFGRTAVPIDFRNSETTIKSIIEITKPKVAFVSKYFRYQFLEELGIKVYFIEDLYKDFNIQSRFKFDKRFSNSENLSEIVFTSGTTGKPKGVMIKQKNLCSNIELLQKSIPDLTNSSTISVLPLSHMLEQIVGLLVPITEGTTIYYLPKINSFRLLLALKEYKPTHLVVVPQLLKIIWNKVEEKAASEGRLSQLQKLLQTCQYLPISIKKIIFTKIHKIFGGNLRFVACGGAPLDINVGKNWVRVGIPVIEGYGATEVTAVATMNTLKKIRLGSAGKPIDRVSIKINEEGEIIISGPSLSSGYFNDSERTKASFTKDGYKTGDIGGFDQDGFLYIKGRDVFKIVLPGGEKVFVEDLENIISADSRVKEVCVVARRLPDGDKIFAYFILKADIQESLRQIVGEINEKLESKQQILEYDLWNGEDFPRTHTLKLDRKQVSEVVNGQKDVKDVNSGQVVSTNLLDITAVVSRVSGVEQSRILETDILAADLGIDSLGRTELVSLAEEYLGVAIDETKINAKTTVGDLRELIKTSEQIEDVILPTWQFTRWGQMIHNLLLKLILIPLHSAIIKFNLPRDIKIDPGSIVIFNHPGIMDGVCVVRVLNKINNLKIITNSWQGFWQPYTAFSWVMEALTGGVPLYDSGQKLNTVLKLDSDLMDRGYNLLFAPQGGLQRQDEESPFKPGIGMVVKILERPVYIIKIFGYRKIWPSPDKDLSKCSFSELLPKRTGEVTVVISRKYDQDWKNLSPIQITNLLEENYKSL